MFKLSDMPTTANEITSEWLNVILQSSGELIDTAVVDLTVEPLTDAGYVGLVARIKPYYDGDDSRAPSSLIFKYSVPDPDSRQGMKALYAREVKFYQELSDQVDLPIPHCYYASFDEETGHSILLLEDLAHLHRGDMAKGCTYEQVESVVRQFARHHSQWWENPSLKEIDFLKPMNSMNAEGLEWFQECWDNYEDNVTQANPDCYLPASFLSLGRQAAPQIMAMQQKLAQAPFTFIHRDSHVDNIMFAQDSSDAPITVLDWQLCGYGPGVSDIAYFMILSVPVALRRRTERKLLQLYHQTLVANGVTNYSFEQCWCDYRLSFFCAFTVSVIWFAFADKSRSHAQRVLAPGLARLTSFAEDHCVGEFLSVQVDEYN